MLLGAQAYLARFAPSFGFDLNSAVQAQTVTVMGDARSVDSAVDAFLKGAGCRVERLNGDHYAVAATLADRIARGLEFGNTIAYPPE